MTWDGETEIENPSDRSIHRTQPQGHSYLTTECSSRQLLLVPGLLARKLHCISLKPLRLPLCPPGESADIA